MSAATENPAPVKRRRLIVLLPLIFFLALAALFLFRLGAGDPSKLPGCHMTTSSIFLASSKSLSVMPLAAWFMSFTVTKAYETVRSG